MRLDNIDEEHIEEMLDVLQVRASLMPENNHSKCNQLETESIQYMHLQQLLLKWA